MNRILSATLGTGPLPARIANGLAIIGLVWFAYYFATAGAHAGDAHAYWAADVAHPYTTDVNQTDAFLYSPAFLLVMIPFQGLPFSAFFAIFTVVNIAVLAWMVGPVLALLVLLPGEFSPLWINLWYGNIIILMAAVIVAGFRWPGAWSFMLLTKVTPGVGALWFVGRRDWKALIQIGVVTAVAILVSFVLGPHLWPEWFAHLQRSAAEPDVFSIIPPLEWRLLAALILALGGGVLRLRWTVVIAAMLAQPVFWFSGLAMLVALLGLVRHRRAILRHEHQTDVDPAAA
ncbi:MAG: glycosyltransferase family 87 protein [Chloroflexota bacterium]